MVTGERTASLRPFGLPRKYHTDESRYPGGEVRGTGFRVRHGMVGNAFSFFKVTLASGMDDCFGYQGARNDEERKKRE
jgi:hypothetical protein